MLLLSAQTEATSLPLELLLIQGLLGGCCFHALLSWREAGAVFHSRAALMCRGFWLCWWHFRADELADVPPVPPAMLLPALGSESLSPSSCCPGRGGTRTADSTESVVNPVLKVVSGLS